MPSIATSPLFSVGTRIAVRTLAVEVVSGPDAGLRADDHRDGQRQRAHARGPDGFRFHLELARHDRGIIVTDLESGTAAGGIRVLRGIVSPGRTLQLGRTSIRVSDGGGTTVEMHGSAYRGNGAALLRSLGEALAASR